MVAIYHCADPSKFTQASCNLFRHYLCCHFHATIAGKKKNLSLCNAWNKYNQDYKNSISQNSIVMTIQESEFDDDIKSGTVDEDNDNIMDETNVKQGPTTMESSRLLI